MITIPLGVSEIHSFAYFLKNGILTNDYIKYVDIYYGIFLFKIIIKKYSAGFFCYFIYFFYFPECICIIYVISSDIVLKTLLFVALKNKINYYWTISLGMIE